MAPADMKVRALEERVADDQVSGDSRMIVCGEVDAASNLSYVVLWAHRVCFRNAHIN